MSYQVLARKWRPRTFHELVGQEHVQRALVNALDQGRLHHAYLFTGTRGVGKTTLARILAKCLNCTAKGHGDDGITSTPCGQCDSCRAIDEGRFVDLLEVDAASRTKVEDTRELLDNVQYAPTQGRYKVYLIDEVHMLSTSSFNALLKTLEEPPPHVKFLLATTDPQKLPATVLSRCLQFTLKNMPPERIVGHLAKVLEAEGIGFEESALWLLGRAADGSMRDAMSLTDQAIAFGQGQVRHADVAAMLGTLDHRHVLALVEALADVDAPRLLAEIGQLAEQGPDFAAVLDDMTAVLHRLAVAQMVPDAVDNGHGDRETVLALASRFTAEDVQLYYQIGIQGRGDMTHAPDLRTALEMTLLRMLAFRPQGVPQPAKTPLPLRGAGSGGTPAAPAGGEGEPPAEARGEGGTPTAASRQPEPTSAPSPPLADAEAERAPEPPPPWEEPALPVPDEPVEAPAAPAPSAPVVSRAATPVAEPDAREQASTPPPAAAQDTVSRMEEGDTAVLEASNPGLEPPDPVAATPPPSAAAPGERFDHDRWLQDFESLGLGGLTRNLAAHCVVEADDGRRLTLRLDPSQEAMNAEIHVRRVQEALAGIGIARQLVIEPGALPTQVETPRQRADRIAAERHAEAVAALQRDPHVRQLQDTFGARLIETTVKPAETAPRA
ncbi:DNA polymerase III subunit gamma/tau [Halomonas sp. MCCC 1A17488]|uniref:DNA polymerase III subunit gamma/tau n=1 Tax=unclassified Halomonas TaxID=2609666 RepID=UPI0018D23680|nr:MULTISPECIES: DNA polymerase III subunit gamma/tau [unclassified Halomonas]MCE8015728.1 DNA polymerase III subunit gamma/tau [Halomonas sp. MCCC 1A17488]MCG3239061.1 DNA polymerase III subunit gamma/tau [Halomonas sp. MCCC 1A17488]QPP50990.1 DNA polymerase III subunit gamma/tau [Halomonas sp. SS10-MC5]